MKMSDEQMIIDKDDYHNILNIVDQMKKICDQDNEYGSFKLDEEVYEIIELLDKADDLNDVILNTIKNLVDSGYIKLVINFTTQNQRLIAQKGDK